MKAGTLLAYYSRRAKDYEQIYAKPERQDDLRNVRAWLQDQLRNHDILEVACGTGYWTHVLAPGVSSITAIDASPEVLKLAKQKSYSRGRVTFHLADAFNLDNVPGNFTAALVAFWFSHVPRHERTRFLTALHRRLGPEAKVVMIDNRYSEGSSTQIARTDEYGNTYQLRTLADGSSHEVLKNFPASAEVRSLLTPVSSGLSSLEFIYFWGVSYMIRL